MNDSSFDYLGGNYYISAASLLLEFRTFIDSHPSLFKVNSSNSCWPKMVRYCEELEKFPEIMRSITRIHISSQIDFERALFCSWCSLLIARSLNLSDIHQQTLFFAGLLQDTGKHSEIDTVSDFSSKVNGPFVSHLRDTDSKDLHPLISATFLEKQLPELDGLCDLVLNHHAKADGTGYPNHVSESQLGLDNQVLIVANEISDRLDDLGGHNQLAYIMPNLKLNNLLYFDKVHLSWINLFEPHLPRVSNNANLDFLKDELIGKVAGLETMLSCLLIVSAELLPYDFDLKVHGLRMMIRRLACLSSDTGIFDPHLFSQKSASETINNKAQDSLSYVRDIDTILRGLPEILKRLISFVDDILQSRKYDVNMQLIRNAREQLYKNSKLLDGNRCNIFR